MSTTLSEQLQKLAVPQTSLLQRDKTRPSLLFDPKVAASIDRDTFYDIGISGLRELEKLNPDFAIYENNLFSATSKNIERAVENVEANKKLDKIIKRFLMQLSPYFLLKPAHKTLEWLIHRFNVHDYNREDFLKLIFPYHETNTFTRCIQLFNIYKNHDKWNWLKPLQKPGIHLPKLTLFNHCASDVGFLKFIATTVHDAVRNNGAKANNLTTLFTFYCTTTIGCLEYCQEVSEPQLSAILPPLLRGLSSSIPDYVASVYMILAQLLRKTELSTNLLSNLVVRICSGQQTFLRQEATLVLLLIFQVKKDEQTMVFPEKAAKSLVTGNWFIENVAKLSSGESYIMPLIITILKTVFKFADDEDYRKFVEKLFEEIHLSESDANMLIRMVLDNYPITKSEDSAENLQEEDEKMDTSPPVITSEWFSNLLHSFEKKYPNAFDKVLREIMSSKISNSASQKQQKALSSVLHFMMTTGKDKDSYTIFEKLYHPDPNFRLSAIRYLVENFKKLSRKDKEIFIGSVPERLLDDDKNIVLAIFSLKSHDFFEVIGENNFTDIAVKILNKCLKNFDWLILVEKLINLISSHEQLINDTKFLIPILPFLFPQNDAEIPIVHKILSSKFGRNYKFLSDAKMKIGKIDKINSKKICQIICNSLIDFNKHAEIDFRENFKIIKEKHTIHKYLYSILITTSLPEKINAELALQALKSFTAFLGTSQLVFTNFFEAAKNGILPLEGLLQNIQIIFSKTELQSIQNIHLDFSQSNNELKIVIEILTILLKGCQLNDKKMVQCYSINLKMFLEKLFANFEQKINFFANFLGIDEFCQLQINDKIQLRILNVLKSLIDKSKSSLSWALDLESKILIPQTLAALVNPTDEIRLIAMNIIEKISISICLKTSGTYLSFLLELLKHKEEILMDCEQLPLVLGTISIPDNVLNVLIDLASDSNLPINLTAKMLKVLTFVDSKKLFESSSKLGLKILQKYENRNIVLNYHESLLTYNLILRFNENVTKKLDINSAIWEFLIFGINQDIINIEYKENKFETVSILILHQINSDLFAALSENLQRNLFESLVDLGTFSENPLVISVIHKVVKKLDLNAKILIEDLQKMRDVKSNKTEDQIQKRRFRRVSEIPSAETLQTREWKKGVTVLEFIQDKNKLINCNLLLPNLFGILKKCLDFDEQNSVEYPKQILLSTILNCALKMKCDAQKLTTANFNMELIVQCIRASSNPQTHYHALLVLAKTSEELPEQVLHNIMAIFTFMGSSVLRHDDAYSFEIISKIVETVIPILIRAQDENKDGNVAGVLRVFVDVMLDVPEHRRMPLFTKLLTTLDCEKYLWLFLLLVFESHVVHGEQKQSKKLDFLPKRLDIASNLTLQFSPEITMKTSIELLEYLKKLPTEADNATNPSKHTENTLTFNINQHTAKQFRHYKYTIVTYLSGILSSIQLVNKIAVLDEDQLLELEPFYKQMIINALSYIQITAKTFDKMSDTPQGPYCKVMLHHCFDIMDSINALLNTEMFLLVIRGLLAHNLPTVRRKALELLNTKLQQTPSFFYTNQNEEEIHDIDNLFALIPSIISIVKTVEKNDTNAENDSEVTQQTALLSLKLLVKFLAAKYPDKFLVVLNFITNLLKSEIVQAQENVLASVILCLAELCSKLRAHAISNLVNFMPVVVKILRKQKLLDSPGLLLVCIITSLQKIIDSLPLFLSPYLDKILTEICILSARFNDENDSKQSTFIKKVCSIRSNIGNVIPSRVLIPIIQETYNGLLNKNKFDSIGYLMHILSENLSNLNSADTSGYLNDLSAFFMAALQFRSDFSQSLDIDQINSVENHIISTLTTLILKLSETNFRPFYYRLYDWAVRSETKTERVITFYRISNGIAEKLKALFVLFAGHFVKNAASLLDATNQIKTATIYFNEDEKNLLLIESILTTLNTIFTYDNQNFIDKDKFETLMQPIVDQIENTLGGNSKLAERADNLIIPCLAQFAVATADDALWKQLNYQILLKTRHNLPEVRLIGLKCVCEVARKLGEDFLPLLPETIPFLAELLEDEDENVEKSCQKVVQDLEQILGEPLQKYF